MWCFPIARHSDKFDIVKVFFFVFFCFQNCSLVDQYVDRLPQGLSLQFFYVLQRYEGNYTCIVSYEENGRSYNLTRTIYVKTIGKQNPPRWKRGCYLFVSISSYGCSRSEFQFWYLSLTFWNVSLVNWFSNYVCVTHANLFWQILISTKKFCYNGSVTVVREMEMISVRCLWM